MTSPHELIIITSYLKPMTEQPETDRLKVGTNVQMIAATGDALGIKRKEQPIVLTELLDYISTESELAKLGILNEYLALSAKLSKTANAIVSGKDELVKMYGDGVNPTFIRDAHHIQDAISSGCLLNEGSPDSHIIDRLTEEGIQRLIIAIRKPVEESEGGGFRGSIVKKEKAFKAEYLRGVEALVTAAEQFERDNQDFIIALTAARQSNNRQKAFELMEDPLAVKNVVQPTGEPGITSMRIGTTGRRENPIDALINLVRGLERLDRFGEAREETDINSHLEQHGIEERLSDIMNYVLNTQFRLLEDPVPPVTKKEEIEEERALHEKQIGVLEQMKVFLQLRQQAIKAKSAVIKNGLEGLLEDYRRSSVTTPGSKTPTPATQDHEILKRLSDEIRRLEEELSEIKEDIDLRLEEIREGYIPDIRIGGGEVGVLVHNSRQKILAAAVLAVGIGAVGGLAFVAGRFTAPDGLDETAMQAAATAGRQEGFSQGTTAGRAEGEITGKQAALTALATALNLTNLGENPTVATIAAALTTADEASDLENRKIDLQATIDFLINNGIYTNQDAANTAANIASVENLNTDAQVTIAKQLLLQDPIRRALRGDSAGTALRLLSDLRGLSPADRDIVTATLEAAGNASSASALKSQ